MVTLDGTIAGVLCAGVARDAAPVLWRILVTVMMASKRPGVENVLPLRKAKEEPHKAALLWA
jgi:hypothetical protein